MGSQSPIGQTFLGDGFEARNINDQTAKMPLEMLFMSEEGTEQGGLIWGAHQEPDGTIQNHSHLS